MNKKLSPAQERALAKLTDKYSSAYKMKESCRTLQNLVERGMADSDGLPGSYAVRYRKKQQ